MSEVEPLAESQPGLTAVSAPQAVSETVSEAEPLAETPETLAEPMLEPVLEAL